ncbi:MAG: N-acetylglucosamine-6-phosphate deacetylase [Thermomicrobium sp.]|nr:N-acetylglucosamine-6-phosphate deacetylase [Thermomicrobium sp.]
MVITFAGADLLHGGTRRAGQALAIAGTRIVALGPEVPTTGPVVDLSGFLLAPGFIDLHTHGGGGFALHTTEPEEILSYARWVTRTGTTGFLVNVVGVPEGLPERQLAAAVRAIAIAERGARPLGIYLEGPFLNPARRGAHHPSWLRPAERALAERLLRLAEGHLRVVTLAPELPGAMGVLERFVAASVTVALGHTDASYETAREAFARGARLLTHCFNAMPPLLHRAPGPLGALVECPEACGELVADGHHVLPPVMRVLVRALGPERTVVVTDAQPGAGLPPGTTFAFAGLTARVEGDLARLADGTIAGSLLTTDRALRNLVELVGVPLEQAVRMLTETPAHVLGLAGRTGRLAPGYDADLVVLDADFRVHGTVCRGRIEYASRELAERLAAAGVPNAQGTEEPASATGSVT